MMCKLHSPPEPALEKIHGRAARIISVVGVYLTHLSTIHDQYLYNIYIKKIMFVDLLKSYLSKHIEENISHIQQMSAKHHYYEM